MSVAGSPGETSVERVAADDHLLLTTPWPTLAVAGLYLYFVLRAGPRMMENRPAFQLRPLIIAYNLILVVGSTCFVIRLNDLVAIYFVSKVVELLDTVFFILRRKMSQVTFLHVYHHTNMVVMTWLFIKMVPGSQLSIIPYSNTFVHILMYGYYFLAALGPSVQKYLWWKKYLTRIQLLQFLVIIGYMIMVLTNPSCQVPKVMIILAIINTTSFLVLFILFYLREYSKKKQVKSE